MGYHVRIHHQPAAEIARVIREQSARAQSAIANSTLPPAERARKARVACKKIRAALRLISNRDSNTGRNLERRFRDAARGLSSLRDAGAVGSTFDRVREEAAGEVKPRAFYVAHRLLGSSTLETPASTLRENERAFRRFGRALALATARAQKSPALPDHQDAPFRWAEDGFGAAYADARYCFRRAQRSPTDSALHTWRKRVKTHAAHCALLRAAAPEMRQRQEEALRELAGLLGYERDLGLLREHLCMRLVAADESDRSVRALLRWIDTRRDTLRAEAFALGDPLFDEKPRVVTRRVRGWWEAANASPSSIKSPGGKSQGNAGSRVSL